MMRLNFLLAALFVAGATAAPVGTTLLSALPTTAKASTPSAIAPVTTVVTAPSILSTTTLSSPALPTSSDPHHHHQHHARFFPVYSEDMINALKAAKDAKAHAPTIAQTPTSVGFAPEGTKIAVRAAPTVAVTGALPVATHVRLPRLSHVKPGSSGQIVRRSEDGDDDDEFEVEVSVGGVELEVEVEEDEMEIEVELGGVKYEIELGEDGVVVGTHTLARRLEAVRTGALLPALQTTIDAWRPEATVTTPFGHQ